MTERDVPSPRVWLVDGYNALCAGLLGGRDRETWWSEANREELLALLERFDQAEAEIWVAFDGARDPGRDSQRSSSRGRGESSGVAPEGGLRVRPVYAPSADEWLLEELRRRDAAVEVAVVTADRSLASRARRRGARVVPPREFLRRCMPAPPGPGES